MQELHPELHNAWLSYARKRPEDSVGDDFFWTKLILDL
jgi:hypothetical protein